MLLSRTTKFSWRLCLWFSSSEKSRFILIRSACNRVERAQNRASLRIRAQILDFLLHYRTDAAGPALFFAHVFAASEAMSKPL